MIFVIICFGNGEDRCPVLLWCTVASIVENAECAFVTGCLIPEQPTGTVQSSAQYRCSFLDLLLPPVYWGYRKQRIDPSARVLKDSLKRVLGSGRYTHLWEYPRLSCPNSVFLYLTSETSKLRIDQVSLAFLEKGQIWVVFWLCHRPAYSLSLDLEASELVARKALPRAISKFVSQLGWACQVRWWICYQIIVLRAIVLAEAATIQCGL